MQYSIGEVDELGVPIRTVTEFIRENWKRRISLAHPEFYEWNFRRPPAAEGRDRSIVIVDGNGAVRGYLGVNPRPFCLDGIARNGGELTIWLVDPACRGKGLGPKLAYEVMRRYEVLIGNNPTDETLSVYTRLGFRFIRALPRFVRIVDQGRVEACSQIDKLGRRLIQTLAPTAVPFSGVAEEIGFDGGFDEADILERDFNTFTRDADHVRWRYGRHPAFHYRAFRVRDKGARGVLILRVDRSPALTVLHVVDLFGDSAAFSGAVSFVDALARDEAAHMADFHCTSERVAFRFWEQGWFSTVDDECVKIPNLFYPVELRNPATSKLILFTTLANTSFLDRTRLYVSKGDMDMDRPTQAYLDHHGIEMGGHGL
jgi:GNAT superfamily N-acetyltransferase